MICSVWGRYVFIDTNAKRPLYVWYLSKIGRFDVCFLPHPISNYRVQTDTSSWMCQQYHTAKLKTLHHTFSKITCFVSRPSMSSNSNARCLLYVWYVLCVSTIVFMATGHIAPFLMCLIPPVWPKSRVPDSRDLSLQFPIVLFVSCMIGISSLGSPTKF